MINVYKDNSGTLNCVCDGTICESPVPILRKDRYGNELESLRFKMDYGYDYMLHKRKIMTVFVNSQLAVKAIRHLKRNDRVVVYGVLVLNDTLSQIEHKRNYQIISNSIISVTQIYRLLERAYEEEEKENWIVANYEKNRKRSERAQKINYSGMESADEFIRDPDLYPDSQ